MKNSIRIIGVATLTLSLSLNAVLLLGGIAWADRAFSLGMVDIAVVTDKLKQTAEWQEMTSRFEDQRAQFRLEMQDLTKLRYLLEPERTELKILRGKATPTRSERRRVEVLESKSKRLDQEFQALAVLERPTSRQDKRLSELQRLRETSLDRLTKREQADAQRLSGMETDLLESQQKRLTALVGEISKERQFDLIVDKQLVLYGGQDLTQEVLGKVSRP